MYATLAFFLSISHLIIKIISFLIFQPTYGASVLYPAVNTNQSAMLGLANTTISPPQPASVMFSSTIPVAQPAVPLAAVPQVPAPSLTYMTPNVQISVPQVQPSVIAPSVCEYEFTANAYLI